MRLLDTKSLQLVEFLGTDKPPYAILSHTWGAEEVLLEDIRNNTVSLKKGFSKLQACCNKAAEDGFQWVWVDTCCIDKSSSAELSEAINSMFAWYQESTVCYAYLEDVYSLPPATSGHIPTPGRYEALKNKHRKGLKGESIPLEAFDSVRRRDREAFSQLSKQGALITVRDYTKSRWFTRGWTLQELIAPAIVEFYSNEWDQIGTKSTLSRNISSITGIPIDILRGKDVCTCSVALRMSWASQRQTTRKEDMAYCLLGLFGVNMPLLYGEGQKSFIRLQEEVMKRQEDYSILAWSLQYQCNDAFTGLLASCPAEFSRNMPAGLQIPEISEFGSFSDSKKEEIRNQTLDVWVRNSKRIPDNKAERNIVMYSKDYEKLRSHSPYGISAARDLPASFEALTRKPPKDPLVLTSRGLRLWLPVRTLNDPKLPMLAWIYCQYEERLLCISIMQVGSSQIYARHAAPCLISVDAALRDQFVLREIYTHPTGLLSFKEDSHGSISQIPHISEAWGRVRIVTAHPSSDYTTLAVEMYPPRHWSIDEIFFTGAPPLIGTVEFQCCHDEQMETFVVIVGLHRRQPWCEVIANREGLSLAAIFENYSAAQSPAEIYRSKRYDMAVFALNDDWCFSASVRKCPSNGSEIAYALYVHGCPKNKQDVWVGVHLSEKDEFS